IEFLRRERVDEMAPFLSCVRDCETHELVMLGRNGGRRVYFQVGRQNPQLLSEIERIFKEMRSRKGEQKYRLSETLHGLEVLFADDAWEAVTLWKNGDDFRVLAGSSHREAKIEREFREEEDKLDESEDRDEKMAEWRERKELESLTWFTL